MERRLDINYSRILKPMLQMVLLFLATLCGVSRIQDNKHHSSDVIAGFLLGIVSAVAVVCLLLQTLLLCPTVQPCASPVYNLIQIHY